MIMCFKCIAIYMEFSNFVSGIWLWHWNLFFWKLKCVRCTFSVHLFMYEGNKWFWASLVSLVWRFAWHNVAGSMFKGWYLYFFNLRCDRCTHCWPSIWGNIPTVCSYTLWGKAQVCIWSNCGSTTPYTRLTMGIYVSYTPVLGENL